MPCEVHCPWWVGSWMLCLIKCVQPLHLMVVHIAGQFRPWDIPVWYLHVGPNCLLYTSVLVPKCPDSLDPSHPYPSVSLLNFGSWMRCPSCPLTQAPLTAPSLTAHSSEAFSQSSYFCVMVPVAAGCAPDKSKYFFSVDCCLQVVTYEYQTFYKCRWSTTFSSHIAIKVYLLYIQTLQ